MMIATAAAAAAAEAAIRHTHVYMPQHHIQCSRKRVLQLKKRSHVLHFDKNVKT